MRALVVDDEPDEAALLGTHLRRAGCEVTFATSAEQVLADASLLDVQIAFVDLRLPGMGGWELVEHLRRLRPGLRIVVASVLDEHDYPAADARLPKPFTGEAVQRALREAGSEPDGAARA
ncbi:response regulator [Cellulomonas composti]|uniref:Response regulatory domain-containing protein n=1 Tax=Cellulomonas composti TaxID=266130 RepID=A0A511J7X8_9CELL|nr:response regulator [Cellulomonas composti]GEL94105.1 hypothetical protein CCO02nite_07630 [Cellulomonas composti]